MIAAAIAMYLKWDDGWRVIATWLRVCRWLPCNRDVGGGVLSCDGDTVEGLEVVGGADCQ